MNATIAETGWLVPVVTSDPHPTCLRLRFQFSDGQPLNQRNLRRAVRLARGDESNRKTSSAGAIETSGEVEASGGFPGAKREASCFAITRTPAQT